jgi:hypothetical protein
LSDLKRYPYTVVFSFVSSPRKEIKMFFNNELDLITNLSNEFISEILDEHIDKFESNPPKYILTKNEKFSNQSDFVMLKENVKNFYTNKMETIDLTMVYVKTNPSKNKRE